MDTGWCRYDSELARIWDGIGPDLQYIRVNGTIVGAAGGLAIAALTHLASALLS